MGRDLPEGLFLSISVMLILLKVNSISHEFPVSFTLMSIKAMALSNTSCQAKGPVPFSLLMRTRGIFMPPSVWIGRSKPTTRSEPRHWINSPTSLSNPSLSLSSRFRTSMTMSPNSSMALILPEFLKCLPWVSKELFAPLGFMGLVFPMKAFGKLNVLLLILSYQTLDVRWKNQIKLPFKFTFNAINIKWVALFPLVEIWFWIKDENDDCKVKTYKISKKKGILALDFLFLQLSFGSFAMICFFLPLLLR